uniref:STAG domain-containing protein n=1 Tax=Plectus sambesii TaxID=2011161 RepID=A0A914WB72_9BILA
MADPPPTTRVTRGTVARQMQEETAGNSFGGDGDQMDHSGMADPNLDSSYSSSNQGGNVFRAPAGRGRKRRSDETAEQATFAQPAKRGRGGRGGGGGRGRGRRATTTVGGGLDDIADESSLFSMVKSGSKKLSVMIDEWIEEYDRHPDSALVQLQQLFISASGCKGVISSNMIQHMEYSEIIRRMTEEFDEESGDYPLVMPGPQWKKFRQNFSDFIQLLVEKCKQSIVFDQKMMDSVIQLLTGLADSQVRAFRHTATFA